MDCENCNRSILPDETVFRVLCLNHKDCNFKVYYFCKDCGEEFISDYRKQGKWIIEN